MIEFINEEETKEENLFDSYFERVITPLVEAENKRKDKYHHRFWSSLWAVLFLVGMNFLVVLFQAVMHKRAVSLDQIILVLLVSAGIVVWPIWSYKRQKKVDVFNEFLKFYGQWNHIEDNKVIDESIARATNQNNEVNQTNVKIIDGHLPIAPGHSILDIGHNAVGEYVGIQIQMRDAAYRNLRTIGPFQMKKTEAAGVRLNFTLPIQFPGMILLFDKTGFYRKNKYDGLEVFKPNIQIANYFNIFTNNLKLADDLLRVDFFETVLDFKDVFRAKKMYIEIRNNTIKIFLEGSALYFDSFKFWSQKIDKNRFRTLHEQFGRTFAFAETIRVLTERI